MKSEVQNLNNSLSDNFNMALNLFEQNLNQKDLLEMLKDGNIAQRQIAALKISEINSVEEAFILTQNLVGQDGKIREAVSLKITELLNNSKILEYFLDERIYDILLNAVIDVNSNVCRNVISALNTLKSNESFIKYFVPELISMTEKLILIVKEFDFQDGKYKVNKEVFKLYWCLETIFEFTDYIDIEVLKHIIFQTKNINEYTIREKTAKILTKNFEDTELEKIRQQLKQDKNYYVQRF